MSATKMKTSTIIGHVANLKPEEAILAEVEAGKYKVETLAGNHQWIAPQEITSESPFHNTWPVVIHAGFSNQQALQVSYMDNKMASNFKPTTFQDEVCLFCERLQLFMNLPAIIRVT